MHRLLPLLAALVLLSPPSAAETIGGNPGPAVQLRLPATPTARAALDCYFDAVQHLYTMCRHVKSIEIIEFGYENSIEGINGAKSESCVDKQKVNMTRPYQAALKEARVSKQAVEGVRSLHELWLAVAARASAGSPANPTTITRRARAPYDEFSERIEGIRTSSRSCASALAGRQRAASPRRGEADEAGRAGEGPPPTDWPPRRRPKPADDVPPTRRPR